MLVAGVGTGPLGVVVGATLDEAGNNVDAEATACTDELESNAEDVEAIFWDDDKTVRLTMARSVLGVAVIDIANFESWNCG